MTAAEGLLYGVIQGLTEFLPISSSAHLILLPRFLGRPDPGLAFDVFLHLGTLLATLVYFRKDWLEIIRSPKWLFVLSLATMPALVAGVLLHSLVSTTFRGNLVMVLSLSLGGIALYLGDRYASSKKVLEACSWKEYLWVGVFQCLALIPGVSRSGSTILGGRILGLTRTDSARLSFLLAAPVTAAALAYELKGWTHGSEIGVGGFSLLVAALSSFLAGLLAIEGLLRLVRKSSYLAFGLYRIVLALAIALILGTGGSTG